MAHKRPWGPRAVRMLASDDPFPRALDALGSTAPEQLFIAGRLPELAGAVAIVGTRHADAEGVAFARALARDLAAAGSAIISGGALGIDSAAHRGALDAGGRTVAVIATPLGKPYPERNVGLFAEIAATGAVVSEHDENAPVRRHSFLARNRLIAALAETVVVVQAPVRSGALSTAREAFKLEKPVFAVPYAPWDEHGQGCLALLRRGANICTSTRDILSLPLRWGGTATPSSTGLGDESPCHEPMDEDCRAVWGALRARARHPDELAVSLGLHVSRIRTALTQLLLLGLAAEVGPGRFAKASGSTQQ